jgi:predicted nicotinamide N-methyase
MNPETHKSPLPTRRIRVDIDDLRFELEVVRDLDPLLDFYVERHSDDVDMIPYYAELWQSGTALAKYLALPGQGLRGVRVCELGCGLGLPSLVAARRGAVVTATDYHPHNEPYLRRNLALNGIAGVTYAELDWAAPPQAEPYPLVFGSDLLYEERKVGVLVSCAARLCAPAGRIIIADPGRRHLQAALSGFRDRGFRESIEIIDDMFILDLKRAG